MHMSDALLSPAVGGIGWLAAAGLTAHAARATTRASDPGRPPLMGVLGAFVFAAQMVNFSIPGTGSSGHIGGGLLLAVLVGPHAGFLVMASVLAVQALLFADGGLLALGCNLVNLGLTTCFFAYPLVYRPLVGPRPTRFRLGLAAVLAAVVGFEVGAFLVVLETTCSGISALPYASFLGFMLPIHLAIGIVEGLVTAGVLAYVGQARPELLRFASPAPSGSRSMRVVSMTLAAAALALAASASWLGAAEPDGLEWAMGRVLGQKALSVPGDGLHRHAAEIQKASARLPSEADSTGSIPVRSVSFSGMTGAMVTLGVALATGFFLRRARFGGKGSRPPPAS